MHKSALLILALSLAAPSALAAGPVPALRDAVTVADDLVRIGDLVSDAGALADIAVFRAPDLGHVGSVPASQVLDAVRRHGLSDVDAGGLAEVTVTRLARSIAPPDIEAAIAAALAGQRGIADPASLLLTFDAPLRAMHVEPSAGRLLVTHAHVDPRSGRFEVVLDVAGSAAARAQRLRHTGTLVETVAVAMLARPVQRGDVIRAGDLVVERRARSTVPAGTLREAEDMVGLAARRPLRPAQILRAADLMKPELVRQNEIVTVIYETDGLSLSVRGQALAAGAEGDTVNVLNVHSKRTVQGTVVGPARVRVRPAAPNIIALSSSSARVAAAPSTAE